MSLNIVRAVAAVENSDEFHISRILILCRSVAGSRNRAIEGITKLAKLDFLLRYPNCLRKVIKNLRVDYGDNNFENMELDNIESKMVRFRYGPWDARYRRWIGLMVSMDMINTYIEGRTVLIRLTEKGREYADRLVSHEDFQAMRARSEIISQSVGKYSGTKLKDMIYNYFPELLGMNWGEEITL